MYWQRSTLGWGIHFLAEVPEIWPEFERFVDMRAEALHRPACDLRDLKWVYPTTLLPLGCYLKTSEQEWIPPEDEDVANYIMLMIRPRSIDLASGKTYIPVLSLPVHQDAANDMIDYIARFHGRWKEFGGESAFKYLVGELTTNICEHSGFSNAYLMAQKYEKKGFLEMAFFDDGITIPGSLRNAGHEFGDGREAIPKAVDGLSAKADVARGYGLSSNMRMCT